MGRVLLLCPSTGLYVDTETSMSARAFAAYRPRNARTFCPHCHRLHRWTKERMILEEGDPPAPTKPR